MSKLTDISEEAIYADVLLRLIKYLGSILILVNTTEMYKNSRDVTKS